MIKLLFLSFLLSTSAFANRLILSKSISSASHLPRAVFEKDCNIYAEGFAIITTRAGSGPTRIRKQYVSYQRVIAVQLLLGVAKNGRIKTVGASCDGANKLLDGYIGDSKLLLDEDISCGNHKVNQSPVTPALAGRARVICGF
jgi:hypothetical protein